MGSRDSSVGIATGYGLDGPGSTPAGARYFSVLHSVHAGSEAHPASYPVGTGGSILGVRRREREPDNSPRCSVEVKNGGAITALPHTSSWRGS
jgi:hypothetical protein